MSCRVVTKTDLGHVYSRVRRSLVYQRTVKTAVLANIHFGIFTVPLIKGCTVTKTVLGQTDITVIRSLANVGTVTATRLANTQDGISGVCLQCYSRVTATVLVNIQG
ncbi:hypothetical protein L370_02995 [Enterobacter sp. MGH 24]|nr:hypothetical protein L370_02995 [Enterobacter sp. MGH 24]